MLSAIFRYVYLEQGFSETPTFLIAPNVLFFMALNFQSTTEAGDVINNDVNVTISLSLILICTHTAQFLHIMHTSFHSL